MEKRIVKFAGCFFIMQSISVIAGGACSSGNTVQAVGADYDRDDERDNGAHVSAVQDPDVEAAIISVSARRAHNLSDGTRQKIENTVANAPAVKRRFFRTAETVKFPNVDHEKLVYFRELAAEVEVRKNSRSTSARGDEKKSSREEDKQQDGKSDQNSLNVPHSSNSAVTNLD